MKTAFNKLKSQKIRNSKTSFNATQKASWQGVSSWYNELVGKSGSYYHEHIVIPKSLKLLNLKAEDSILDLGCGQGIFARKVNPKSKYVGIDVSPSLISFAKKYENNPLHNFYIGDCGRSVIPLIGDNKFSVGVIILALQNMKNPTEAILNFNKLISQNGKVLIVLNHPAFRIPRQSSWGIDKENKLQYRRVNIYMNKLDIPITMHPGRPNSKVTWTYHYPISFYIDLFTRNGFIIDRLEEWTSDKTSEGKMANMENRSREEFPLFLAIRARKT